MQARKRSFFEEFTVAFAKPALWEKCRELTRILPLASPNELHVVFPQICGDVFGYGAGGMFNIRFRFLVNTFSTVKSTDFVLCVWGPYF